MSAAGRLRPAEPAIRRAGLRRSSLRSVTELAIGREVRCGGVLCGTVAYVVWDPSRAKVTYLVVQQEGRGVGRLLPVNRAIPIWDWFDFGGTPAEFALLPDAEEGLFLADGGSDGDNRSDHVLVWNPAGGPAPDRGLLAA